MTKYINILLVLAVAATLWACHSTEANYKESYDKAVAASRSGEKGVLYQQDLERRMKANRVVDGDSIRMLNHHFNVIDDKSDISKKYNVVVAEFKQKFNAQSYRDRLRKEEGRHDDLSAAAEFAKNPENYMKLNVLVPRAWVLTR